MLDFLNEVLMIDDLEPDAYQMGISGKSGAKMKAPDGGKASMKGDFNALHPRYPKGHPQGGKFMPKGSKDQINAVAKAKGVSTEQAAAMVGGKAPANKGKLGKFSGSAGAVGKAQKVLKNKDATPEQRAKAKASIQKAAMKMRGEISTEAKPNRGRISNKELMRRNMAGADPVAEKPKRGRISNKEIMARNAGTSAPTSTGSMTQGVSKKGTAERKREKLQGNLDRMNKRSMDIRMKEGKSEAYYKNQEKSDKYARVLESSSMRQTGSPAETKKAIANSIARNKAKTDPTAKAARKESAYKNSPKGKAEAKERKAKVERNIVRSQIARDPSMNWLGTMGSATKRTEKSIARNQRKKAKRASKLLKRKREKLQGNLDRMNKRSMDIRMKEGKSEAYYKNQEKSDKYARVLESSSMRQTGSPAETKKAIANSIARNKAKTDSTAKAARKESAYKNSPKGKAEAKARKAKVERNVIRSQIARDPSMNWLGTMGGEKRLAKSIARNQQKKAKNAKYKAKSEAKNQAK